MHEFRSLPAPRVISQSSLPWRWEIYLEDDFNSILRERPPWPIEVPPECAGDSTCGPRAAQGQPRTPHGQREAGRKEPQSRLTKAPASSRQRVPSPGLLKDG